MSYEFLNSYTIPVYTRPVPPQPPPIVPVIEPLVDYARPNLISVEQTMVTYPSSNRFTAPGGGGRGGRPRPPVMEERRGLKRSVGSIPYSQHQKAPPSKVAALSSTPLQPKEQMTFYTEMVNGYPEELRRVVHPYHCELCDMRMNSLRSAADHYQSKTHDRHINTWLQQNYTDKSLPLPEVKRTLKKSNNGNAPTGPDAFHCELCDLKLTSLTHATQHYSGRKHKLVASKVSKPSGAGFYNSEGKWVRTGSKLLPSAAADGRFGIGEAFKTEVVGCPDTTTPTVTAPTDAVDGVAASSNSTVNATTTSSTTTNSMPTSTTTTNTSSVAADGTDSLICNVCNVSVTSSSQMAMHVEGSRHKKKLRQAAIDGNLPLVPTPASASSMDVTSQQNQQETSSSMMLDCGTKVEPATGAPANSILASLKDKPDPSTALYRTPSGFYYCKACNISMSHESALQQHLLGKKHLKKEAEERARGSNCKK